MSDFSSFIPPCLVLIVFTVILLARGFAGRKLDVLWVGIQHDNLKVGIMVKASKVPENTQVSACRRRVTRPPKPVLCRGLEQPQNPRPKSKPLPV
jgi:hypothetical protein